MMKIKYYIKILPLFLMIELGVSQTTAERLEQGVQLQIEGGDVKAAIVEYQLVVQAGKKLDKLVAEARYRLAECHKELGNEKLVEENLKALRAGFPEDNKWVVKAAALKNENFEFQGVPWKDDRIFIYETKVWDVIKGGSFVMANRIQTKVPQEICEFIWIGRGYLCSSEFTIKDYRPIKFRYRKSGQGDVIALFGEDKKVTLINNDTGETKDTYTKDTKTPMFDNLHALQMIRALNQKIGTKQKISHLEDELVYILEVTDHVDLTVRGGTFSCAKIEGSDDSVYYISRGKNRELVRMVHGPAKMDLIGSEEWDVTKLKNLKFKRLGASIDLPGTMIHLPVESKKDKYEVQMFASDFAGADGILKIEKSDRGVDGIYNFRRFRSKKYPFSKDLKVDGIDAFSVKSKEVKNDITTYFYQVFASNDKLALSFRLNYAKRDEARAIARVQEILKGFRWESSDK